MLAEVEGIETAAGRETAVALLRTLVAARAAGEDAVQDTIAERLGKCGCVVREIVYDPGNVPVHGEFATGDVRTSGQRRAVVGTYPGNDDLPSLLMFAHPDTEPVANIADWTHDPFAGEIEDGRIYGWGIADDLAGCAAALAAMERLAASESAIGRAVFASTPSKRHARGVAAILHDGLRADAALYLHPAESGAGLAEIKAIASGELEFTIAIAGSPPDTTEPSHTAFSHLAINPLDKALLIRDALSALAEVRAERVHHSRIEAQVGRATNLHISGVRCGDMERFSRIAKTCVIGGAVSFPPGESMTGVQAEIVQAVSGAAAGDPWLSEHPPVVSWRSGMAGAEVPPDHPLYRTAAAAVTAVTGAAPRINPMHTTSDIRNPILEAGIPCIGLGCIGGDLSQNDNCDEWVSGDDFLRMVDVTARIAADWCSGTGTD